MTLSPEYFEGLHPLRSLVISVLSHFGPRTDVHIHFGPQSVWSSVISVLKTEAAQPIRSFAKSLRSRDVIVSVHRIGGLAYVDIAIA